MNKLLKAKQEKLLNKQYYFDSVLSTYKEQIDFYGVEKLHTSIQEYSSRRIHLEYVKLKNPKTIYILTLKNGKIYHVPKLIYEYAKEVTE